MNEPENPDNYVFEGYSVSSTKLNKPKKSALRKAILPTTIVAAIVALLVILYNTGLHSLVSFTEDLYPTPAWIVDGSGIFGKASKTLTGDAFQIFIQHDPDDSVRGLRFKATDIATGEVLLNWKPSNDDDSVSIAAVGNEVKFEVTTLGFTGMFEVSALKEEF